MSLIDYMFHDDVDALAFQSCGKFTLSGKAIVTDPCSISLSLLYKEILFNLGDKLSKTKTNIPYIVGAIDYSGNLIKELEYINLKNKNFNKLFISCPTKTKVNDSIDIKLLQQSIVVIEDYIKAFDLKKVVVSAPPVNASDKIFFL